MPGGIRTANDGLKLQLLLGENVVAEFDADGLIGYQAEGSLKTVNGVSVEGAGDVEVGYRNIPQNSQSANYTLVLDDSGKHILHPSSDANARTFTIPANASVAFPIGTAITFINDSTEDVTIAITSDTLVLAGTGTTGSRTLAQYGMATAIKIEATKWYISGTGVS